MAKRLTETQRLIKRLQTKFTNKEIAKLLNYKSPSTISALASGKQKAMKPVHLARATDVISHQNIRKKVPSANELKRIRKIIRKNRRVSPFDINRLVDELFGTPFDGGIYYEIDEFWRQSSYDEFMSNVPDFLKDKLTAKLDQNHLHYFYYNEEINRFMISDIKMHPSNIGVRDISSFLFYFHFEKTLKNGEEYERDDIPMYHWYYVLPRTGLVSSAEVESELAEFASSDYDAEHMDKNEDKYSFMGASSEVYPLAYISEH